MNQCLTALLALALCTPAQAAVFTVLVPADAGPGSLRQAVLDANALPGADTIVFAPTVTGTIALTGGEIAITQSLTVQGPGAATLTIDGGNATRLFDVSGSGQAVVIAGLTLFNGNGTGGAIINAGDAALSLIDCVVDSGQGNGATSSGGILIANAPSLTVDGCVFSGNRGGVAGGIQANLVDSVEILDSEFIDNRAVFAVNATGSAVGLRASVIRIERSRFEANRDGDGVVYVISGSNTAVDIIDSQFVGNINNAAVLSPLDGQHTVTGSSFIDNISRFSAIYVFGLGELTVRDCLFQGNTHNNQFNGGAMYIVEAIAGARTTIESSTFTGNSAPNGDGGAIYISGPTHLVRLTNVTVTGNQADGAGGGVFIQNSSAADNVTITNSTIAGNTAGTAGGGIQSAAALDVVNTVIADNTAGDPLANDVGIRINAIHTLVEDAGNADLGTGPGLITGIDPELGVLADNGGPTPTLLPGPVSVVIGAGQVDFAPPPDSDQRGLPRVAGGRIDLGAIELQPGESDVIFRDGFDSL